MVDTLSSLLTVLDKIGARPLKSLSQNFLIDKNIIQKIVAKANICPDDLILEIGPGPGALTKQIANTSKNIIAIEKDRTFANYLAKEYPHITVYEYDFLKFPLRETLSSKNKKAKVIANLPYSITSPIIAKLLYNYDLFSEITIMVQYEMAKRLASSHNSKNYSAFTVFTNFYSDLEFLFEISPNCFFPRPKVKSAIIKLTLKNPPIDLDRDKFHLFVQKCFQQRRKKIMTPLKNYCIETNIALEKLERALKESKINSDARPENLSCQHFCELFLSLHRSEKD